MDIKPTSEKAAEYVWFGKYCLGLNSTGYKAMVDGPFTIICKYTSDEAILIALGGNFLTHPRSGSLRQIPFWNNRMDELKIVSIYSGGYNDVLAELDVCNSYPLTDDDHGTWLIGSDSVAAEWTSAENYGSCWWIGAASTTLSWRGPSNRHFALASDIHIPGLTQIENVYESETFYTSFWNRIYQDGEVLCLCPPVSDDEMAALVVGACYVSGILVCMTVSNLGNGFWFQVWASRDTGKSWTDLGIKINSGRAKTPCFINQTGNRFVFLNRLYEIDAGVTACAVVGNVPDGAIGSRTVSGTGGYDSDYTYKDATINAWPGMSPDGLEFSTISASASFTSTSGGSGSLDKQAKPKEIPVHSGSPPATGISMIAVPEYGGMRFYASLEGGGTCSISWSGVDGWDGLTAFKAFKPGKACEDTSYSVSVTATPGGTASWSKTASVAALAIHKNGNQFSATGGTQPYTWSTDAGSIDGSGLITFNGSPSKCQATVTVTDFCKNTASTTYDPDPYTPGNWSVRAGKCMRLASVSCQPDMAYLCLSPYYHPDGEIQDEITTDTSYQLRVLACSGAWANQYCGVYSYPNNYSGNVVFTWTTTP